jgi:hypothetical protein
MMWGPNVPPPAPRQWQAWAIIDARGRLYRLSPTEPTATLKELTNIGWAILPCAVIEQRDDPPPPSLFEWLWRMLPDRCEMPDCARHGIRGHENVVDGRRMCDDCHMRLRLGEPENVEVSGPLK